MVKKYQNDNSTQTRVEKKTFVSLLDFSVDTEIVKNDKNAQKDKENHKAGVDFALEMT